MYGISVAYKENSVTFIPCCGLITEDFITDKLKELALSSEIYTIGLKEKTDYISSEYKYNIHDISLIAYLLNPLKSGYDYDDIAAEFLNSTVSSRTALQGKKSIAELFENDWNTLAAIYGNEAYTAYMSFENAYGRLEEAGMADVYRNIELPVLYVLKSMEKEGIMVNKTALKQYGDELAVKIAELEKDIYELAGTEFNINSPKQLGEILFEKMGLPSGKKTKTGYSTSADVL